MGGIGDRIVQLRDQLRGRMPGPVQPGLRPPNPAMLRPPPTGGPPPMHSMPPVRDPRYVNNPFIGGQVTTPYNPGGMMNDIGQLANPKPPGMRIPEQPPGKQTMMANMLRGGYG